MGLMDKIKNALFEVEYVEVDEEPKKEKRFKKEKEDKPIAKKIVLPGRKEEKVEELQEEELKDEDFEIRPKDEEVAERPREEFKIMNDNDFRMDDDIDIENPEIVEVIEEEKKPERDVEQLEETPSRRDYSDYYSPSINPPRESKPYGLSQSYNVSVSPYGTYGKEEKTYFKPSPIISPIYGILDKNYRKEDVREKRDVHLSSYSRSNVSVDEVRNKAYGEEKKRRVEEKKEEVVEEEKPSKFEVEEEDNLLVDLSDRAKPEVKELTMGDAEEYFQDLGLEYNVDYVDVSKEKSTPKQEKKEEAKEEEKEEVVLEEELEEATAELEPVTEEKEQEVEKEEKKDNVDEDDDNLFDLIDSMYQDHE